MSTVEDIDSSSSSSSSSPVLGGKRNRPNVRTRVVKVPMAPRDYLDQLSSSELLDLHLRVQAQMRKPSLEFAALPWAVIESNGHKYHALRDYVLDVADLGSADLSLVLRAMDRLERLYSTDVLIAPGPNGLSINYYVTRLTLACLSDLDVQHCLWPPATCALLKEKVHHADPPTYNWRDSDEWSPDDGGSNFTLISPAKKSKSSKFIVLDSQI
jgi:hypothetical protein